MATPKQPTKQPQIPEEDVCDSCIFSDSDKLDPATNCGTCLHNPCVHDCEPDETPACRLCIHNHNLTDCFAPLIIDACPFCRYPAVSERSPKGFYITCTNPACLCAQTKDYPSRDAAAHAWNSRTCGFQKGCRKNKPKEKQ